jgi:hypothetical protein
MPRNLKLHARWEGNGHVSWRRPRFLEGSRVKEYVVSNITLSFTFISLKWTFPWLTEILHALLFYSSWEVRVIFLPYPIYLFTHLKNKRRPKYEEHRMSRSSRYNKVFSGEQSRRYELKLRRFGYRYFRHQSVTMETEQVPKRRRFFP